MRHINRPSGIGPASQHDYHPAVRRCLAEPEPEGEVIATKDDQQPLASCRIKDSGLSSIGIGQEPV